jgi:hypothetical protein
MQAYIAKNFIPICIIVLLFGFVALLKSCWRTQLQNKDFKVTVGHITQ